MLTRCILPATTVLGLLLAGAAPAPRPARLVSVSQTLAKLPECSQYYQALVLEKLEPMLDGPGPPYPCFAVFAPTNAAFARLRSRGLGDLFTPGQERKRRAVITYSLVSRAQPLLLLQDGQQLTTMHANVNLRVMQQAGHTWLSGGTADPVEVRAQPIPCDNGCVFVIEEVLVPLARRVVPATGLTTSP